MDEDVFPFEHGDFPASYVTSGVFIFLFTLVIPMLGIFLLQNPKRKLIFQWPNPGHGDNPNNIQKTYVFFWNSKKLWTKVLFPIKSKRWSQWSLEKSSRSHLRRFFVSCIVQGHNDASSEAEVSESEPGTTGQGWFQGLPKDMGPANGKLHILFPYHSQGFLWEWYGNSMGTVRGPIIGGPWKSHWTGALERSKSEVTRTSLETPRTSRNETTKTTRSSRPLKHLKKHPYDVCININIDNLSVSFYL